MTTPTRQPSVDVAVPCYRYGAMLPDAVASILAQEGVDVRVLVIDDASDDGSADVAHALAAADDRVTVRVHEQNMGHIATFTEGAVEWPEAEYGLLISADDMLPPGALARATALMEAHPGVGLVYGNCAVFTHGEPVPPPVTGTPRWTVHDGETWLRRRLLHGDNVVPTPAAVFRTSVQRAVGGYNPDTLHTSDFEMWMRFALHADIGFIAGVDQGFVRVHGSNMSAAYERRDGGVRALHERMIALLCVLERIGDTWPDTADVERRMRRTLAKEALVWVGRSYDKGEVDDEVNARLVAFATEAVGDDLTSMTEWRSLQVRKALGPRIAPALSPLVVTAAGRRVRQIWRERRLRLEGV